MTKIINNPKTNFTKVENSIILDKRISGVAKDILLLVLMNSNRKQEPRLHRGYFAAALGLADSTIKRAMKVLIECGYAQKGNDAKGDYANFTFFGRSTKLDNDTVERLKTIEEATEPELNEGAKFEPLKAVEGCRFEPLKIAEGCKNEPLKAVEGCKNEPIEGCKNEPLIKKDNKENLLSKDNIDNSNTLKELKSLILGFYPEAFIAPKHEAKLERFLSVYGKEKVFAIFKEKAKAKPEHIGGLIAYVERDIESYCPKKEGVRPKEDFFKWANAEAKRLAEEAYNESQEFDLPVLKASYYSYLIEREKKKRLKKAKRLATEKTDNILHRQRRPDDIGEVAIIDLEYDEVYSKELAKFKKQVGLTASGDIAPYEPSRNEKLSCLPSKAKETFEKLNEIATEFFGKGIGNFNLDKAINLVTHFESKFLLHCARESLKRFEKITKWLENLPRAINEYCDSLPEEPKPQYKPFLPKERLASMAGMFSVDRVYS